MATQTAHFELEKPALTDVADIAVLNNNFDDIDTVMFENQERSKAAVSNQADAYDAAQTYAVGDLVIYEDKLYKCVAAVTVAEPWDSTKWEQTTLAESGGTGVEANPTGTPTDTLETIDINGTVYEVGGSEPVSKTVTGNPIHIEDAAAAPIVSGEVVFEPIQDLHGYDKPWVGGTGKNKLQNTATTNTVDGVTYTVNSDGSVVASGTANGTAVLQICSKIPIDVLWGTVTLSGLEATTNLIWNNVILYDDTDTIVERIVTTGSGQNKYNKTFNLADYPTASKISVSIKRLSDSEVGGTIYPQLELGSTATDYESYSNECPIEGYTECEIEVTGKNLLDESTLISGQRINDNGTIGSSSNQSLGYIECTEGQTYTVSALKESTAPESRAVRLALAFYTDIYGVGQLLSTQNINNINYGRRVLTVTAPTGAKYMYFSYTTLSIEKQIEIGSGVTSYEPYQSTTSTIDLDGTRYGGKVYPVTGKMSVGLGHISSYAGETIGEPWLSDRDEYVAGTTPSTGAEVVYTLASPTIVQLVPQQIRTLEGTNNISTNMTSMSLEYITESYQPLVKLIERSAGHHFSEQEKVIGTWIDGKTLYEKVVDFGALPNTTSKSVAHNISNLDSVCFVDAIANNGSGAYIPVPFVSKSGLQYQLALNITSSDIVINTGDNFTNYSAFVTLQYTKTTD